jgi:hypothetical protein
VVGRLGQGESGRHGFEHQ